MRCWNLLLLLSLLACKLPYYVKAQPLLRHCRQIASALQVPIIAKADSMTSEELREFRAHVRAQLEHVRATPWCRLSA